MGTSGIVNRSFALDARCSDKPQIHRLPLYFILPLLLLGVKSWCAVFHPPTFFLLSLTHRQPFSTFHSTTSAIHPHRNLIFSLRPASHFDTLLSDARNTP